MLIISTIACAITNNCQAKVKTLLRSKSCYDKTHEQTKLLSSSDQSWVKLPELYKHWRNLFYKNKTHQKLKSKKKIKQLMIEN